MKNLKHILLGLVLAVTVAASAQTPFNIDPSKQTTVGVATPKATTPAAPVAVVTAPITQPKLVSDEDVQYFLPSEHVPAIQVPLHPRLMPLLEQELAWLASVGLNKAGVTAADFDMRLYRWGGAGLQVLVKHTGTGKTDLFDLGLTFMSAYPTAVRMTQLAQ